MKFTIDRSKWRCGGSKDSMRGKGATLLLNGDGFMCCLGQVSLQLGAKQFAIRGWGTPGGSEAPTLRSSFLVTHGALGSTKSSAMAESAMIINDNPTFSDSERESKLTSLFAEHGHEIEFVGEYVIPEGAQA